LARLLELDVKWSVTWRDDVQSYYIVVTQYLGMKNGKPQRKYLQLHRYIMQVDSPEETVDHINHDTTDNRKANLRVLPTVLNTKNRNGKNKNNKSGYRNVSWNGNQWIVQLQVDGKNTCLGKFDDVHEAGKFASEMRIKYYGEYKGFD
jgi:hypothetical protein